MSTITFRTDPEVDEALAELSAGQGKKSDVIRAAILVARQQRRNELLLEESRRLKHDEADVEAVREVMADMENLRAW